MLDLLILLGFNSALCYGFWNACLYIPKEPNSILRDSERELRRTCIGGNCNDSYNGYIKGVLWFIEKWSKDKWFYKPLVGCIPCMASLHSIYPYWAYSYITHNITIEALLFYPVYVLALSGVNYLIDRE